jgi:tetratricopeptide (TPR) repeat protein/tRNA A-37 threonylcarbamoyl transferase component Bud32
MPLPQHLEALLALALEKPADRRPAFLDSVCDGDTALRARLEELLATRGQPEAPGAGPAEAADAIKVEPGDKWDEAVGQTLGRYKLLEKLGEGGCGVVYVAEQTVPVRRRVALKVIKLGMDTKQVVARFEAERQALAMMDHPNIAKVLDAGATEQGRPFFVMELVRGIRITDYCDQNQLATKDRLDLFMKVCQAIQHAHQKGIIHRDIKPSNILVAMNDGVPVPKVIDFGIAKATEGRLTEHTIYTQLNQFVGTPAYMSPEQAEVSGLDIDTRSDIYSLGVLLYELLTGSPPFDPHLLVVDGIDSIRRTIREIEPPRPSTRLSTMQGDALTAMAKRRGTESLQLLKLIRGDLDWIVMKCLEKDRTRRYETANGLAMDIHRHLVGEAVVAVPPSSAYRMKKLILRHRVGVAAAGAVTAALLIGVVAFAWQARIARQQRDRAVAAEAEAKTRASELAKVSEFQSSMLSDIDVAEAGAKLMTNISAKFAAALAKLGVPEAERMNRTQALERELAHVNATDTALEMIDRTILKPAINAAQTQFKDQPVVDANLLHTIGDLYRVLGLYPDAVPLEEQALAIRRRVLGEDDPDTLTSLNDLGVVLEQQGKWPEAEKYYREALEKREKLLGPDHKSTLTSLGNLGNFLRARGNYKEAEPLLRSAVERSKRVLGETNRDTFIQMNCLGFLYISEGRMAEAEPLWRDAYEKGRRALGEDDPDVLAWINNLAGLLQVQGKIKEAEPYFQESVAKHRRIRGEDHPNTITAIGALAGNLSRQGRYAEAEALYLEDLEKSRRVLGNDHRETWVAMNNIGNLYTKEGRLAEAEPYLREVLAARQRLLGPEHPDTLIAMDNLAKLLMNQGEMVEAEKLFRDAVEKSSRVLGKDHPDTLIVMNNFGNLLMQQGRLTEAEPLVRETLEARRRVSGAEHPETLIALNALGRLEEQQGKLAEAEAVDREAMEKFRKVQGTNNPNTLASIANLASLLLTAGKPAEADPLCREALASLEQKFGKDDYRTASVRLSLGMSLADLHHFAEAEKELMEAEQVLATAQGVSAKRRREGLDALAKLYDSWQQAEPGQGHDLKAAEWKKKLEAFSDARRAEAKLQSK